MCNGAQSNGVKCSGDICNGSSSVIYDTLSLNGVTSQSLVSSVEKRQIGNVLLRIVHHESDHCKEFAVVNLSFKIYRWLIGILALICVGYYMQLHVRDPRLMFLLLMLLITALIVRLYFKVMEESLLVMASVGIQVTRTFALGRTSSKFYHITHINNVVINEAVTMHQVIYYLTILLHDGKGTSEHAMVTQLMPLFQHCWPSLECLQLVYQGVQQVLFDQAKKHT